MKKTFFGSASAAFKDESSGILRVWRPSSAPAPPANPPSAVPPLIKSLILQTQMPSAGVGTSAGKDDTGARFSTFFKKKKTKKKSQRAVVFFSSLVYDIWKDGGELSPPHSSRRITELGRGSEA